MRKKVASIISSSYWIRSSLFSMLQRFSVTLFGFLSFMLLARSLTREQLGVWSIFLAISISFELSKIGLLKSAHIRFVSATTDPAEKRNVALTSLVSNASITLLFTIFVIMGSDLLSKWLNAGTELSKMLILYIPGAMAMVFFTHYEAVQQSYFDFKGIFQGHLTKQITFFFPLAVHYFFKIPLSLNWVIFYYSLGILFGTMALFMASKRYLSFEFKFERQIVMKIWKFGGYILGSSVVSNIMTNIEQLMTARFLNPGAVSYYGISSRISGFVDVPSYAATDILYPKMAQAATENESDRLTLFFEQTVGILWSIVIPISLVIFLFPDFFIRIIAGGKYEDAAPIVQIYMLCSILGVIQNQAANALTSIGHSKLCFQLNIFSFSLKLVLIFIFLKAYGFYGVAIGTLAMNVLNVVVWYGFLKRQMTVNFKNLIFNFFGTYERLFGLISGKKKL